MRKAVPQQIQQHAALAGTLLLCNGRLQLIQRNRQLCHRLTAHRDTAAAHFRRQHQAERLRQRAMRILRHALRQPEQLRQHGWIILQRCNDVPQLFRGHVSRFAEADDDTLDPARAERNLHPLTDRQLHPFRHTIGENMRDILMHNIHNDLREHAFPPISVAFLQTENRV